MEPRLTIQILGWNSAMVMRPALEALTTIPKEAVVMRYIDNGSEDESVALVRELLPEADVVEHGRNSGFSGGHNLGFRRCDTELVMVHNPDLMIDWEGVQAVMKIFDDPVVGAAQGKLYRSDNKEIIDSAGIVLNWSLNGVDRGAGRLDGGEFEEEASIVAVTGAAGMYRMAALQDVAYEGSEVFDEDFFAYKEDVDLGWRLGLRGWKVVYVPVTMGFHSRSLASEGLTGWSLHPARILQRLRDPRTRYSLRNWIWMVFKNGRLKQMLLHEVFVDFRLFLFLLLSMVYWPLLPVWMEILRGLPRMAVKRDYYLIDRGEA